MLLAQEIVLNRQNHREPSHTVRDPLGLWVDEAICVLKSLPVVSLSIYAPPAHRRASGAASGATLGRCAPPRAARAPPFPFPPTRKNCRGRRFFGAGLSVTAPAAKRDGALRKRDGAASAAASSSYRCHSTSTVRGARRRRCRASLYSHEDRKAISWRPRGKWPIQQA